MATYVPAKRGVEYIFYVSLIQQADTKLFQANPTLAAGDVTISKDGGAFANLTTLPTVTPASGKSVKVTLSAAEMTADQVLVVFSDAAGAQWCDLSINIQTAARQIDDLCYPTTSGRSIDVDATGGVEITANQAVNVAQWNGSAVATPSVAGVPEVDVTHVGGTLQTAGDIIADTNDIQAKIGTPVTSVSADIAGVQSDTNDIQARLPAALVGGRMASNAEVVGDKTGYALTSAEHTTVADTLLNRDMSAGTDTVSRSVRNALRPLRNKWTNAAGTYTVYKEDDTTSAWTSAVSTDGAAIPIVGSDPA